LEGGGLYATVDGDDFEGTEAGMGFEAQAKLLFTGGFSIGAGFYRSSHDLEGTSENLVVSGFFAEPRYIFAQQGTLRPFLLGRFGLVKQRLEVGADELEGPGTIIGGGAGLGIDLSPTLELVLSAAYHSASFGDFEVNGFEVPDSDLKGSSVVLRLGLSVALGAR
jgi:hypothetical protein